MATYNNKVIFAGEIIMDLSNDTVTADKLAEGITAHDKSGAPIVGTNTFNVDSKDGNITAADVVSGKIGYANGQRVVGAMPINGAVKGTITNKDVPYNIPAGSHDGSGTVAIDDTEKAKLIPDNIREGITILGVEGAMSGAEDLKPQQKTVTPKKEQQVIIPDEGFNALSQVTVQGIPYQTTENPAGGNTVTIG